jgi:hypothetical protein
MGSATCTQEADGPTETGAQPDQCTPASLPALPDPAVTNNMGASTSTADRPPATASQSRRKRKAAESLPAGMSQRQKSSGPAQPEQLCAASLEECPTAAVREDAPMACQAELPLQHASTPLSEAATPARPRGLFGAAALERPGCATIPAEAPANPLLLNLPCRSNRPQETPQPAKPCTTPALTRSSSLLLASPSPVAKALRYCIAFMITLTAGVVHDRVKSPSVSKV